MKDQLKALSILFTAIAADVRPGGQAEIDYKQGMVLLQGMIDAPDPEPEKIVETQIATETMANSVGELVKDQLLQLHQDGVQEAKDNLQVLQDTFTGFATRLTNVEASAAAMLATLDTIKAQTAPAPAPAPAPADQTAAA